MFELFVSWFADVDSNLLKVVERELKTETDVKERQVELLKSIVNDVSEPTKQLLAKLNCTTKCNCKSKYVAVSSDLQNSSG